MLRTICLSLFILVSRQISVFDFITIRLVYSVDSTGFQTKIHLPTTQSQNEAKCRLLPGIALGLNHMVRMVEFTDQTR